MAELPDDLRRSGCAFGLFAGELRVGTERCEPADCSESDEDESDELPELSELELELDELLDDMAAESTACHGRRQNTTD